MPVVNHPCRSPVPVYGHAVIRRPRLNSVLTAAAADPGPGAVALLSAPVGSGKTMLLADWAAETAAEPYPSTLAWLTSRDRDNDRAAFTAAVVDALRCTDDPAIVDALRDLPADALTSGSLSAALGSTGRTIRLVIDDVHVLHDPGALGELGEFLAAAPPNVFAVLSGRHEPPLALHRMRVDGLVRDLSPHDLAFTETEAAQLFSEHGIDLDARELAALEARTQGWAVGLRLAAITLARHPDPAAMIADFTGDNRVVADYLVGEVLANLEASVREFVVESSIPESFSIELAEALTGNTDSGRIVDDLERENFLVERVPGRRGWFRYHPLLREYLRAEVGRRGHVAVTGLEQIAAGWFSESGSYPDALEHTLHTGDADTMISLLDEGGLRAVLTGDGDRLLELLGGAPRRVLSADVTMRVRAAAELARGAVAAAESLLGKSDSTAPDPSDVFGNALRVRLATLGNGDTVEALDALAAGPVGHSGRPELDAFARLHQGIGELYADRVADAETHLEAARDTAEAAGLPSLEMEALAALGALAVMRCRLTAADRLATEALDFAARHRLTDGHHAVIAGVTLAWVRRLRMTPVPDGGSAVSLDPVVLRALASCPDPATAAVADHICGLDPTTAVEIDSPAIPLDDALLSLYRHPAPPAVTALLAPVAVRRALAHGNEGRAVRVAAFTAGQLGDRGEVAVMRARIESRRGRDRSAARILRPVLDGTTPCVVPLTRIHALLLSATLTDSHGDDARTRTALTDALALAEPEGVVRPFHDERDGIRGLLDRNIGRFGVLDDFAAHVRELVPASSPRPDRLLTRRERELLTELPSWRTAEQIAADLYVSVNTVKTHLRGIYRKLGVGTRQEAIAAARSLGLL